MVRLVSPAAVALFILSSSLCVSHAQAVRLARTEPSFDMPLRFPGQYADRESNLVYNGWRPNMPGAGRFIQADPIGLEGGPNRFVYADANPLVYSDSTGLRVEFRCRPVGSPTGERSLRANAARLLGGEHCFVLVHCPEAGLDFVTISYLAPGVSIVARNGGANNDTIYSDSFNFRELEVSGRTCTRNQCALEKCISQNAARLVQTRYRVPNYSAVAGPNSNSVAKRLVEMCRGEITGRPPLTGWGSDDKVGF